MKRIVAGSFDSSERSLAAFPHASSCAGGKFAADWEGPGAGPGGGAAPASFLT